MGPDEEVLLAHVAHLYYRMGKTRVQIAEEMDISRFKVARILEDAQKSGIVRIVIRTPSSIDAGLSRDLGARFGLSRCIVIATPAGGPDALRRELGRVAAALMEEIVVEGDVIGLTAGRTLSQVSQQLGRLPFSEVVQLAGIAGSVQSAGIEVIRRVSQKSRGRGFPLYSPLVASDAASAEAFKRQPDIRNTYSMFSHVTKAFVAIGSWNPPDSQMYDATAITPAMRSKLSRLGVQAELCATLLDDSGQVVPVLANQCISIGETELRAIPEVVAVAGGSRKVEAIRAAVRSGLVDSLVTDSFVASNLLTDAK